MRYVRVANLPRRIPLETVACIRSGNGERKKPENTTLDGFFKAFAGRFIAWQGPARSLWTWQKAAQYCLVQWCPLNKKNDFKWEHIDASEPFWTLSPFECRKIAYKTTYHYGVALMQYEQYRSRSTLSL